MIRANGAAEAAQTDRLKAEVEDYTRAAEELKSLCERNQELVQKLQFMNRSAGDEYRRLLEENNTRIEEKLAQLQSFDTTMLESRILEAVADAQRQNAFLIENSDAAAHKDHVRVYRNVQASVIAELAKQTEQLSAELAVLKEQTAPDAEADKRGRISYRLLIALLAVQLLEGAGLAALLLHFLH
jgi:LmbE family N-acetylglucosaminyl deacetylase